MTEHNDRNGDTTRRTFVQTAGAAVALGGVSRLVGAQQDGPQLIVLYGRTAGWQGVAPDSIADTANPTLPLVAGQDYEVRWTNVDGAPHNFVIRSGEGQDIVSSDIISTQGATQNVRFTATEDMATYICDVHPTTMQGNVKIVEEQQLEPVNVTQLENQTEVEAPPSEDQNITGGVEVSEPIGLGGQDWPNNSSQVLDFRQGRQQRFRQTGNGTIQGNLTYGTNETQANATNETQGDRAGAVSANDVRQVARLPGFGVLATLGGVFGGLAALSKRSDD